MKSAYLIKYANQFSAFSDGSPWNGDGANASVVEVTAAAGAGAAVDEVDIFDPLVGVSNR